jgi:hypothetical protein
MGSSLWRQDRSVVYCCSWPSPAQLFPGPSPVGLVIIFCCLRFETSPFVVSHDSQSYGGGIQPCLHTRQYPIRVRVRVTLQLAVYRQSVHLGAETLEAHDQIFFPQMNTCGHSPYITSSLTRGWVCHLQLLLDLVSAFILGCESHGTRDHILLSQIRDFPFYRLLRLVGLRWRYSILPPHGKTSNESQSQSYVKRTVSRPVCLEKKHTSEAYYQIFITLRQLRVSWYEVLSLTRGRICRLPESQSAVISLLSVCTICILHVIKCMYIQNLQGLCLSRLSTADHAPSLVATATTAI